MNRIFISHSLKYDRDLVNDLKDALKVAGFETLQPSETFNLGTDIASQIISAIRSSDTVLAIIGRERPNVLFELGYAMGSGKNVLLISETDEELPAELQSLPCVRLSGHIKPTITEIIRRITMLKYIGLESTPKIESVTNISTAEEKLKTYYSDPDYFESIDGITFEKLLIELFQSKGIAVKDVASASGDFGYDFAIESSDGKSIIVEAKKLSRQSKISVNHIRSLLGAASIVGASSAMLISTSGFTSSAVALAASVMPKLHLVTLDKLLSAKDEKELLEGQYEEIEDTPYSFNTYSISRPLIESIEFYRNEASSKGIIIKTLLTSDKYQLPDIEMSLGHITRVFKILIHNAIKYSFSSSTENDNKYIEITGEPTDKYFRISIVNYGIGISPDEIRNGTVFMQGYRGTSSTNMERLGSGIGLSIVKNIIDKHNGMIDISSEEKIAGYLTTVNVYLPYKQ